MNIKTTLGVIGLVGFGGLAFYSVKKFENSKNVDDESTQLYKAEDYIIGDLADAEDVLAKLKDTAGKYDCVYVADYYDLLGVPSTYKHNAYAWSMKDLDKVKIIKAKGGYSIALPPAKGV